MEEIMKVVNSQVVNESNGIMFKHASGKVNEAAIEFASEEIKDQLMPVFQGTVVKWLKRGQDEAFTYGYVTGLVKGTIVGAGVMVTGYLGMTVYRNWKNNRNNKLQIPNENK